MRVCMPSGFSRPPLPTEAGKGYRFLRVGELTREGDEFWCTDLEKWLRAPRCFVVVPASLARRYRRKAA